MKHAVSALACLLLLAAGAGAQIADEIVPPGHSMMAPSLSGPHESVPVMIKIHGVQKTPNGSELIGDEVLVELNHQGKTISHSSTRLDMASNAIIDDLRVAMPCQVVVTISHGGGEYRFEAATVSPDQPEAKVDAPVYDTTTQAPAWQIMMHHVMVQRQDDGLHVTEIIVGNNPADRTWLGEKTLQIPPGAQDIKIVSGFDDADCKDGRLVHHTPMMPGQVEYHFEYMLRPTDGTVSLPLTAAAPTKQVRVLLPEDDTTISTSKLDPAGSKSVGETSVRMYAASSMAAGETAMITIAGLPSPNAAARAASRTPKIVAAVGGGLILVCGLGFVLFKPAKRPAVVLEVAPLRKGKKRDKRRKA